jgi:hypothetical protein
MVTKTGEAKPLKRRTKVVAAVDLLGVPEGTSGRVNVVDGVTWLRYGVTFDNGVFRASVDHNSLVREKEWEQFKRDRAEAAERAAREPVKAEAPAEAAPAAETPADSGGGSEAASKVPAHLLERARKAREKKAAGGEG